jgi:NitT/TauT family transport system substrate-binding protein
MKKVLNHRAAVFGLLFVALVGGAYAGGQSDTGSAAGQDIDKIRLGVMAGNTLAIATDVGAAKGIFTKHGLDVEVITFAAGINTIDAITIGQLDIGEAADFAILNRIGGTSNSPLRIFSGYSEIFNNSGLYTADPSVNIPADLAGKSVITRLGTVWEYYYAKTFAAVGISESRIKYLPVESPLEAVALIQAGTGQAYYANGQAEEALKKIPGIHLAGQLRDYVEATVAVFVSNEQFLREHPGAVKKFLEAFDEIYQIIRQDPHQAAEISYKASSIPVDVSIRTFGTMDYQVEFNQKFYDALNNVYQWAEGAGVIKNPYDLHKYVNVSALKAAFPGRGEFK